jgi:hypothetical protein
VEDEAAAMEVHDHRELFEAAARDLWDEEAGAQVVGDGVARQVRGSARPARSSPMR